MKVSSCSRSKDAVCNSASSHEVTADPRLSPKGSSILITSALCGLDSAHVVAIKRSRGWDQIARISAWPTVLLGSARAQPSGFDSSGGGRRSQTDGRESCCRLTAVHPGRAQRSSCRGNAERGSRGGCPLAGPEPGGG